VRLRINLGAIVSPDQVLLRRERMHGCRHARSSTSGANIRRIRISTYPIASRVRTAVVQKSQRVFALSVDIDRRAHRL